MRRHRVSGKLLGVLLLAALYGGLNYLTLGWHLPGASAAVSIRPQVVVPLLAGYLMGPLAGFIVGGAGNLFGDWLCGFGVQFWPFSLGNGLMGGLMGLLYVARIRRIDTVGHFSWLLLAMAGGNALCMGAGLAIYNLLVVDSLQQLTWTFFHPMVVSNVLASFLLVPPLLLLMKRLSATFDLRLCASLFYLLILVLLPLIYGVMGMGHRGLRDRLATVLPADQLRALLDGIALANFRGGGTIGIAALLASLAAAFLLVQYVSRPVRALLRAANQLRDGHLDQIDLSALSRKNDELGRLAQVFEEAVGKIRERETALHNELRKLQVDINREQATRQVTEITETEYFKSLRRKSLELRARKQGGAP